MPSSAQNTTATDWPDGVIARYLTPGSATVDITFDHDRGYIVATCTGERCGWWRLTDTEARTEDTQEEARERFEGWLPASKAHAQQHAEVCRAMPKPANQ